MGLNNLRLYFGCTSRTRLGFSDIETYPDDEVDHALEY